VTDFPHIPGHAALRLRLRSRSTGLWP
jgi:hypothetical protein